MQQVRMVATNVMRLLNPSLEEDDTDAAENETKRNERSIVCFFQSPIYLLALVSTGKSTVVSDENQMNWNGRNETAHRIGSREFLILV
mmetsp:Transcript_11501/g.27007  ORF Transcript_11501/g.27007 Transcript_11501/m.27007 type:complete len:88 (+) Transcript_11501:1156-1419(+)